MHNFLRKQRAETELLLLGKQLANDIKNKKRIESLHEVEFKVFSQFGDDGIIQWIVANAAIPNATFIEFGVEDYRESNTRFLMMNDNWSGMVIDGSDKNVARIVASEYFWRHDLRAIAGFIDRDNINSILESARFDRDIGILSIDIDGNDYWVFERIEAVRPAILILEFNSVFGRDNHWTVPYDAAFHRTKAHPSNLYWGASLSALTQLADKKGYALLGCNSAGNNAYFLRRDKLNDELRERSVRESYVESKFRESRDPKGNLTYLRGDERLLAIRGLPIYDTKIESLVSI